MSEHDVNDVHSLWRALNTLWLGTSICMTLDKYKITKSGVLGTREYAVHVYNPIKRVLSMQAVGHLWWRTHKVVERLGGMDTILTCQRDRVYSLGDNPEEAKEFIDAVRRALDKHNQRIAEEEKKKNEFLLLLFGPPPAKDLGGTAVDIAEALNVKQVIVVRKDLGMRKGKAMAQCAHASMKVVLDRMDLSRLATDGVVPTRFTPEITWWLTHAFTKIVCGANSEQELRDLVAHAELLGIPCALIVDNGVTEFDGVPTVTACAIGPAKTEDVNVVCSHLTLL